MELMNGSVRPAMLQFDYIKMKLLVLKGRM